MGGKFNSQAAFIRYAKLDLKSNPKEVIKKVPIREKKIQYSIVNEE